MKSYSNAKLTTAVGFIIGLVIGVGIIVWRT